jgi:hypothetical protein
MNESASTFVEVTSDENGTWLNVDDATISLSHSPGHDIHNFFKQHVLERTRPVGRKLGHWSRRSIAYVTGIFALMLVAVSAVGALVYAATHRAETLSNLASSTLTGIGMAIGGCLGSALILRFKAARHYLRSVLKDLQ